MSVKADVTGAFDGLREVRAWVTADNGVTWQRVPVLGHDVPVPRTAHGAAVR
ncbi:hypothetical protein [Streptomyces sp. NPDC053755]|uniref:hypothetical protein n=1 Tax=Streptomyces sp. NPDC053755 TaxID=3155815 RepID=UPI00341E8285